MKRVKFDFYTVRAGDSLELRDDEEVVSVAFSDEMAGEYEGPVLFDVMTATPLN